MTFVHKVCFTLRLLKTTFLQISIHGQLLVKNVERSDKEKNTFNAIEKYRYGLWKTILKHLKTKNHIT